MRISDTELVELNEKLRINFGYFDNGSSQLWRVVWSHDEFEDRVMTHSDEGFELIRPTVRRVPKYRQWNDNRYVLERCVGLPDTIQTDMVTKTSYEPIWTFEGRRQEPLAPTYRAIKFLIDNINANAGQSIEGKYQDAYGTATVEEARELKKKELDEIYAELYGNETDVTDSLSRKEGIVVPHGQNDTTVH